jgi:hypothetical protein
MKGVYYDFAMNVIAKVRKSVVIESKGEIIDWIKSNCLTVKYCR